MTISTMLSWIEPLTITRGPTRYTIFAEIV